MIDIWNASSDFQTVVLMLFKNLGQVGNIIFIVCSSWFLLDSRKSDKRKIISLWIDCMFVSVLWVIFYILMGYELPIKLFLRQLMPISLGNFWFLTCYMIFYAIHPFLNIMLEHIEKEEHIRINIMFLVMYSVLNLLLGNGKLFYSPIIGFIGVHFLVAYMKKYCVHIMDNEKIQIRCLLVGILGGFGSIVLLNILGLHIGVLGDKLSRLNQFHNPFFILLGLSALNLAKRHKSYSSTINYISGLSLLIYMLQGDRLLFDYVKYDVFRFFYAHTVYRYPLFWVLFYAFVTGVISLLLAAVYKNFFQKKFVWLNKYIYDCLNCLYGKVLYFVEKLN